MRKALIGVCAVILACLIVAAFAVDYAAYKERFPHAAWWSYLFQGGR